MFLTRSIRRKLAIVLALTALMILALCAAGLSGLLTFRSVIGDLDFALNRAPRRSHIQEAMSRLFEPLLLQPATAAGRAARRDEVLQAIAEAERAVERFRDRLDEQPPSPSALLQRNPIETVLRTVENRLSLLRDKAQGLMADNQSTVAAEMVLDVAELQGRIQRIPTALNPSTQDGLSHVLETARTQYRSHIVLLGVMATIVTLLFALSLYFHYHWIFGPIKELHKAAQRVATGDFRHRVKLSSHDEIAQLADTFNAVVERFDQVQSELNEQVNQRSQQLVRSERMAGVGFLAAGVAHEINNPLSAIAMAAESLEGRMHESELSGEPLSLDTTKVLAQYLAMIQREAFRCQQITSRLLNFARGTDAPRTRQDLSSVVSEVIDMVSHLSKYRGHQIVFDGAQSVYAEINSAEVKQVVLNLVANALESIEGPGRLEISLAERVDDVELSFRDNGCGMTADVLEHLFQPFFTTNKKTGKGTGLGLCISHRIVTDHGGRIEAQSDGPGKGSTFTIRLPRLARSVAKAA